MQLIVGSFFSHELERVEDNSEGPSDPVWFFHFVGLPGVRREEGRAFLTVAALRAAKIARTTPEPLFSDLIFD